MKVLSDVKIFGFLERLSNLPHESFHTTTRTHTHTDPEAENLSTNNELSAETNSRKQKA